MTEKIKKVVATYYGYNFNEYGACLNKTLSLNIKIDRQNYIKVFTYRQQDGAYLYDIHFLLGIEKGWGGGTAGRLDVYPTEKAAILGALRYVKERISKPYKPYESYKKQWQCTILNKLNNEIRKLTQPKQMSIFDYTTETLNF